LIFLGVNKTKANSSFDARSPRRLCLDNIYKIILSFKGIVSRNFDTLLLVPLDS
jgi:hypothetical protein